MSKATIIGVIVLMTISLLGMVGLQLYWISDAIQVKQEQFDRGVHEALTRVVAKLETQEAVTAVANGMATLQHTPVHSEPATQPADTPKVLPTARPKAAVPVSKPEQVTAHSAAAETKPSARTIRPAGSADFQGQAIPIAGSSFRVIHKPLDSLVQRMLPPDVSVRGLPVLSPEHLQQVAILRGIPIDTLHAQAYNLNKNNTLRIRRMGDSAISYTREVNGRSFRISADTLQYIALHLDSLRRSNYLNQTLSPSEIASINVRKDSIFIMKKGTASRMPESTRDFVRSSGEKITFRSIHRPAENRAGQETPARMLIRPAKRQALTTARTTPKETDLPGENVRNETAAPDPAKVEAKKERLNDVVEKMVVEYVVKDVPLQDRLNLANLKPMLQSELHDKGIALEFGYWVLSGQQDTVAVAHLKNTGKRNFATYKASLFPNDIFEKPDYLAVYFPDSQAYAIRSLWMMLLFSALFTLVMVATFGTTIHIIFRQKKLSDMKNDFINNMTHEFKTPIATISLATDSIANPKIFSNPDKIKYYTDIIRQENKRMNVQVENVLQIAQLEKNDYRMNLQPVDLHSLICKAVDSIRLQVEERLGQISAQLNALEHELNLDEVHAYNVICNLLDNANKYSPSSPDIRLVTQNVEGGILLAVEDKGMGMTRDTQLRVFEKFYRVPTGNLHNVKGFGLGLSYVKAIVKAHNGNISLHSEPGKGSRFEIFLPFN